MTTAAPPKSLLARIGAEPRKLALLGALVVVALGLFIYNRISSDGAPAGSSTPASTSTPAIVLPETPAAAVPETAATVAPPRRRLNQRNSQHGVLRMRPVAAGAQLGAIDPTLRLDLLARLRNVQLTGGSRSLFETGAAAAAALPATKAPKIIPGPLPANHGAPIASAPPGPPPPPPIPLSFYGYTSPPVAGQPHRGFFLEGDNIFIAAEGDVIKNRYRVVKLAAKSAEVEDLDTKSQQSLLLAAAVTGAN